MEELFGRERSVISKHIRNIFKENELEEEVVCANFALNKDFEQTKEYFHKCLSDIENGNTQLLSQEQYTNQMNDFKENLKSKYANN